MYSNTKIITVDPAFVFKPVHLLAIASRAEQTVFPACENLEVQLNCTLKKRTIGGSLSALTKLNPDESIDSFSISFQNGPYTSFTVEKSGADKGSISVSIQHPDNDAGSALLDKFCRIFPV